MNWKPLTLFRKIKVNKIYCRGTPTSNSCFHWILKPRITDSDKQRKVSFWVAPSSNIFTCRFSNSHRIDALLPPFNASLLTVSRPSTYSTKTSRDACKYRFCSEINMEPSIYGSLVVLAFAWKPTSWAVKQWTDRFYVDCITNKV